MMINGVPNQPFAAHSTWGVFEVDSVELPRAVQPGE
jgi:hypothetical protein